VVSTDCAALRCSAGHALAGIAIATMTSLRHRSTTDSGTDIATLVRRALAEVCTVPLLLVQVMFVVLPLTMNGVHTAAVFSADARAGVRKRDGDHTANVRAASHLPVQDERAQGLLPNTPHSSTTQTTHAGIFPDDVVSQQRH